MANMTEPIIARSLAELSGIRHGFFTRAGGVSQGIYASLNCGHGSDDERVHVIENRRRVAVALGQHTAGCVLTLHQVHSATALVVAEALPREALPKADALVTRTRGLVVGALAADCAPILFADAGAGVVAAAHAGWRGAFTGVIEATVSTMEGLGADRARISAAVGPCINQAAYEVGPEFEARFLEKDPTYARFFRRPVPGGRPHFDLPEFVEGQMVAAGIGTVERRSPCTFETDSLFFSYRRSSKAGEPDYGRQISAIVLN
jgi:YfiH family protein